MEYLGKFWFELNIFANQYILWWFYYWLSFLWLLTHLIKKILTNFCLRFYWFLLKWKMDVCKTFLIKTSCDFIIHKQIEIIYSFLYRWNRKTNQEINFILKKKDSLQVYQAVHIWRKLKSRDLREMKTKNIK